MSDEYKDVTKTGLLLGGAGLGIAAALSPTIIRNRTANKAAMRNAEKIVKHLKTQGIKKDAVIAITGVGGSGKSSISRALKNHGYKHIPLDGVGDAGSAAMASKGFSPGTVVDQAFVLKKTGGGHYDAVIKADNPGQREIRRRLVKRQQGAKTLYNHIDYGKFDD